MRTVKKSTNPERDAWAKHLRVVLPLSPTGESVRLVLLGAVPSKANQHEIRFAPRFWRLISSVVRSWIARKQGSPFWVSPGAVSIAYEEAAARSLVEQCPFQFEGPLAIDVKLYGQRTDIDNALKILLDSIEKAGLVSNDRLFTFLTVEKFAGTEPRVELCITQRGKA